MDRSGSGVAITMREGSELLGGIALLRPEQQPPYEITDPLARQVDDRIEHHDIESVPITLSKEQTTAIYASAQEIVALGLSTVIERLNRQHRRMLDYLGVTMDEAHAKHVHEDAESYFLTALRFKALVDTPENA